MTGPLKVAARRAGLARRPTLLIMRGLPACGKTVYAREWVGIRRGQRVRVNRDDLRLMLDEAIHVPGLTERRVVMARDAIIATALAKGYDVVVDETSLDPRKVMRLAQMARRHGARPQVQDMTDVPLETCLARNELRTGRARVPAEWIQEQYELHVKGRPRVVC